MIAFRIDARWEQLSGMDGAGGRFGTDTFTAGAGVAFYWQAPARFARRKDIGHAP